MDSAKEKAPPPEQLRELPPHVRRFLASLDEDDIELLKSQMDFSKWFKTTSRFVKVIVVTGMAIFGGMVALAQGWDYIMARFFIVKTGG